MTRRFRQVLFTDATTRSWWLQTQALRDAQAVLVSVIPGALQSVCRVGSIAGSTLKLFADNGAVATKLRLVLPELQAAFHLRGWNFTAIRVSVQVRPAVEKKRPAPQKQIDSRGRAALESLAERLGDSPLAVTLKRLAALASKNSG